MKLSDKKTWIIALLVILLPSTVIALYLLNKKKKDNKEQNDETEDKSQENNTENIYKDIDTTNLTFPLVKDDSVRTELVKQLQRYLNKEIEGLKLPNVPRYHGQQIRQLTVDGIYGDRTAAVVKYVFPNSNGLSVTQDMYDDLVSKRESFDSLVKTFNNLKF